MRRKPRSPEFPRLALKNRTLSIEGCFGKLLLCPNVTIFVDIGDKSLLAKGSSDGFWKANSEVPF